MHYGTSTQKFSIQFQFKKMIKINERFKLNRSIPAIDHIRYTTVLLGTLIQ